MSQNETRPYKIIYKYFDENLDKDVILDFMVFAKTLTEIEAILEKNNVTGGFVKSITALPGITALY